MYSEKVKRLLERLDRATFIERDEVILELGRLKTEEALQALLQLAKQTTHIADLHSIVRAIGLFRSPAIVEPLLELWRKTNTGSLRAEIIRVLDCIEYPGVLELIEQEFLNVSAKSFCDSERLIDILCRRGDARSMALLLEGFDHLASRVTASDISPTDKIVLENRLLPFLRALGELRVRESWSRIKDLLFEDVSDWLRCAAVQAMMKIDPHRTAPLLFDLTRDKKITLHFRKTIYDAIGQLNDERVRQKMLELLRDPKAEMRKIAINWLGFMGGDDRLIDLLLKHARYDRSIQVQTQAARTVSILLARARRFQSILPLLRDHPVPVALGLCVVARRGQLPPEGIRLLAMLRQHPEVTRKRNIRRQIESALRRSITEIDRER